jgi:LCP family protein required for cell wall assembly
MSHPTLPPELDPRGPRPKVRRSRQVPVDAPPGPGSPPRAPAGPPDRPVVVQPTARRRWPAYVAGALACLVVVFSVVGSAVSSWYFGKINKVGIAGLGSTDLGQPQNWLLVGSDNRAGLTKEEIAALHVGGATTANASGRRSDTMILLHLSPGTGKATLISLPRDSYVQIPAYTDSHGKHHAASHNKLNAAYDLGGPQLTVQTVEQATGLNVDHYVEVGFGGFVKMVDTLGGVPVCSTTALHDPKSGLNLKAGTTTLNGKQALAYVRARYVDPTADLGRMKRQQAFLGSLFRTALSTGVLLNPLKLNSFLSATLSSVTVDDTVTRDDLLNLAARTGGLSPSHVVFATVPLSDVDYRPSAALGSTVLWDQTKASALWATLKADQPIGSQASTTSSTSSATPVQVAPSRIVVQVSNGGGVSGAGAKAADDLTKLGFVMAGPATNSTLHGVTQTVIMYDPRYNVSLKTLQAAYPDATVKAVKGQGKTFQVVVGTSYQAPKPVVAASTTTTPTTPGGIKTTSAAQTVCKTT